MKEIQSIILKIVFNVMLEYVFVANKIKTHFVISLNRQKCFVVPAVNFEATFIIPTIFTLHKKLNNMLLLSLI